MGREQRRREQFQNKNKNKKQEIDTSIKLSTAVKLVVAIIIFLLAMYLVSAVFITKELKVSTNDNNKEATNNDTQNTIENKILASNIFNQKEEEYYVYFYDFSDEDELASSIVLSLEEKNTVYKVDTSSSLNNNYITEEKGNKKAKNLSELKVKSPTVIKIESDKIKKYYEGTEEIQSGLNK